jgi:predicted transposase YbfD/YdcC
MLPFATLLSALEEIPDPRRRQGRRYSLPHLLLFSVLAVLAGAASYRGIVVFIRVHRERLNMVFRAGLRRAPAVNTLRHLFQALDPAALEATFRRHARQLSESVLAPELRVVALDGKTLRRSFDHLNERPAAHVLSAFASEAALVLAHQEVDATGDEIPAAQALIEALGLRGVLFTADALHCQKRPSPVPRAPATLCSSASKPTSPLCWRQSRGFAPSKRRLIGTRRWTVLAMAGRSTDASRSSKWSVTSTASGSLPRTKSRGLAISAPRSAPARCRRIRPLL